MTRPRSAGALSGLFLLAGIALAAPEAPDPEPPSPRARSSATSGDFTVRVDNTGIVSASNKFGQLLWKSQALKPRKLGEGQVVIEGDHVAVLHGGNLYALDLRSGKNLWHRFPAFTEANLSVKGGKVTLAHKGKREVVDLKTGRLLEGKAK
jgi:outer membrane protein assembly factor BamB